MNQYKRSHIGFVLGSTVAPVLSQGNSVDRDTFVTGGAGFIVYYGMQDHPALSECDIVVLDSEFEPLALRRIGRKALTLGYLSVGEVNMGRPWATELERQGLLLQGNPKWREARFIELRDSRWKKRVIDELIPRILDRGFTGLFVDTLDDADYLESLDPPRFRGMKDAAIGLVYAIRSRFPHVPLMVNRGYGLLPMIVSQIDMVLGESVHSTYDATADSYVRLSATDIRWQTQRLHEAKRSRPELGLFSLDYWSPSDPQGIARLYAQARESGLVPYVATIDLTQVVPRS
jgi:polysaccharide biosynthesis protein PelA